MPICPVCGSEMILLKADEVFNEFDPNDPESPTYDVYTCNNCSKVTLK
ncbi:MAG: hypothetical protein ACTSX6_00265 [Candidatus Heimdallarchaeaceae archaeon]